MYVRCVRCVLHVLYVRLVCTLRTVCVTYVVRALSTHPLKHGDVLEQVCIRILRTKMQSCDVIGQ